MFSSGKARDIEPKPRLPGLAPILRGLHSVLSMEPYEKMCNLLLGLFLLGWIARRVLHQEPEFGVIRNIRFDVLF